MLIMKKRKRNMKFILLLSISMLAIMLTACGGESSTPTQGEKPTPAPTETSKVPVTLKFYSNNGGTPEAFDLRFGNALRKKFPHFTIEYIQAVKDKTGLPEMVATGNKFDIFFASIGNYESALFEHKLEKDMTPLIESTKMDLSGIEPSVIEAMKKISGGKMYGIPVFNNNLVLYYNKSIFDKFGVEYPKDGMTWDQVLTLAKRLDRNEGGKQYIGLSVNASKYIGQNPFSIPAQDPVTGKSTINTNEKWKQIFDLLVVKPFQDPAVRQELVRLKKVPDHYTFLRDQNLAMYGYLSDLPAVLPDEMSKVDWDMVSLPYFPELAKVGAQDYPSYFGLTTFTEHPTQAMEAINYLISDEFQMELSKAGVMPVVTKDTIKKALGTESPYFKGKHTDAVFYNKPAAIPVKTALDPTLVSMYRKTGADAIALGTLPDINTALRLLEEEANKSIAESNAKK